MSTIATKPTASYGSFVLAWSIGLMLIISQASFAVEPKSTDKSVKQNLASLPKVTFVELGSVNCIPCRAMQKVMDSLKVKYPKDLKIVFHDVWTDAGKPAARQFGIRSIPTQVFLDTNGIEFFRHEGYFPLSEVEKILQTKKVMK